MFKLLLMSVSVSGVLWSRSGLGLAALPGISFPMYVVWPCLSWTAVFWSGLGLFLCWGGLGWDGAGRSMHVICFGSRFCVSACMSGTLICSGSGLIWAGLLCSGSGSAALGLGVCWGGLGWGDLE